MAKESWLPEDLKKSRSQNFLTNRDILQTEADSLDIKELDVLEIGSGDGRLSGLLLSKSPKTLTLVEPDKRWVQVLREKFKHEPRVMILEQDFLTLSDDMQIDVIYGNIPYHITSPIITKIAKMENAIASLLCIQKEVAERLLASPGTKDYGRLTVFCNAHFKIQKILDVSKEDFHPVPKVDSSIIILTKKEDLQIPNDFEKMTSCLFSHRLASVQNALIHSRRELALSKEQAREMAKKTGFADQKVFKLTLDQILKICKTFEH